MKAVTVPQNIPDGPHYQLFVFEESVVHVPGDERSRTNPGHGYPEHNEVVQSFTLYVLDEAELKRELAFLYKENPERTDIVVILVNKKIQFSVDMSVSLPL